MRLVDTAQQGPSPLISGMTAPARRDYTYDAHYRLLTATGRVHQALLQYDFVPRAAGTFMGTRRVSLSERDGDRAVQPELRLRRHPGTLLSLHVKHVGQSPTSWTTEMWVSGASNRSAPALDLDHGDPGVGFRAPEESRFDAGGNLVQVAHLRAMEWTWKGALGHAVVTQRDGDGASGRRRAVRVRRPTGCACAG